MSGKVRVLLLESIAGLGEAGSVVTVTEGYARNYLFPHSKAALADDAVMKIATAKHVRAEAISRKRLTALQAQAESLNGTELTVHARLKEGEGDAIFGSITASRIAKELARQAGVKVVAKDVQLTEPIRRLGTYDITLRLAPDVEADLKLTVAAEPATARDAE